MIPTTNSISATRQNLRRLVYIRYIALGAQLLALLVLSRYYNLDLPVETIGALMAFFAIIIAVSHARTYWMRPLQQAEFCGHILVDIVALTGLLYFTGGATNPFVSYYLVPISIAAITLPTVMTWGITTVSLIAYSSLVFFYYPMESLAPQTVQLNHTEDFTGLHGGNLHIIGMWVNFALSAGLITYFVVGMAKALRVQEKQLSSHKEEQMQDEQLLAIASQAASAAHELGTPLNTMKLIIDNFKDSQLTEAQQQDAATLDQQIQRCRTTLQSLVLAANLTEQSEHSILVSDYITELLDNWKLLRPDVNPEVTVDAGSPAISSCFHPVIQQSLQNLLNNAADASPQQIEIVISWDRKELFLDIHDHGPGITVEQAEKLGRPISSDKPGGLGIGLFLSHNSLNRHGGRVSLSNIAGGGVLTSVVLPLSQVHGSPGQAS